MKRLLLVSLALALCLTAAFAEDIPAITAQEALTRMEENIYLNLFDTRDTAAYDQGHVPGAVSFPLDTLKTEIQAILNSGFSHMDAEIIVYGETGEDGAVAGQTLAGLGFTNVRTLGAFANWTGDVITTEEEEARQRQVMGDIATTDIYGAPVDNTLLQGYRLTMVNVWATYCNPCINEMPELAKLSADWAEKGVQIVGLVSDATDENLQPLDSKIQLARKIAEATKAAYPHLLPSLALYQKVLASVSAVPTTLFVDENGALVGESYLGSRSYDEWNKIIEETLEKLP